MTLKELGNVLASTVAEFPEGAPEGVLYAGCMASGASFGDFTNAVCLLVSFGLIERRTGPVLVPTEKLTSLIKSMGGK